MKILAISGGSKNGTNDQMAKEALMGAQEAGADVEFIHMLDLDLKPCNGCLSCVVGKDGVFAGGSARCVRKDDLLWLEDKIYDADGVVFVMPIFEKGLPGFFRAFQDRFAGPSHDIGMLTVAKSIHEKQGLTSGGPDPRAFKPRFATYIGIGGSDWATRMSADFNLFGMVQMWRVVDDLVFDWAKSLTMEDERVARIREAGRSIAKAAMDPESYRYLGDPGICANCHSRLMYLRDDAKTAECSVCGIVGELVIEDGTVKFVFAPEQMEHAHNLVPGKIKHVEDIGRNEGAFAAAKETDEYKRRAEAYKAFIRPSKPEK
jgi:NAD(P)H-dependent FMN reductase